MLLGRVGENIERSRDGNRRVVYYQVKDRIVHVVRPDVGLQFMEVDAVASASPSAPAA